MPQLVHRRFERLRPVFLTIGGLVLIALVSGLLIDMVPRLGSILLEDTPDRSHVHEVLKDLSRTVGVTLSMLVALTGIAIPLTANVYTPKLIELFVTDRGNQVIMGYYVLANVFVHWNLFVVQDTLTPDARLRVFLSLTLTVGGLLMIVPYIQYVLRFLVPQSIVAGLEGEIYHNLARAARSRDPKTLAAIHMEVIETVHYLGNITLRSVDRYDRETAIQGLDALRSVFHTYQERKPDLPDAWFEAAGRYLHSLGPELHVEVERQRSAIEVAVLQEYALVLPLAMGRLPEVVGRIAVLTRRFGVLCTEQRDQGAREAVMLHVNSFIRRALQQRHPDTFYKFVYQYRRFAESVLEADPDHAERICFFLDYYAHQAVRMNISFLINVVAYDLAAVAEAAFETGSPSRQAILQILVDLDRDRELLIDMPGVVKAQIILAAKLRARKEPVAAHTLVEELRKVPVKVLEDDFAQMVAVREENFWEMADRRRHLDHVEPEFRPALEELRAELLGPRRRGRSTARFLAEDVPHDPPQSTKEESTKEKSTKEESTEEASAKQPETPEAPEASEASEASAAEGEERS